MNYAWLINGQQFRLHVRLHDVYITSLLSAIYYNILLLLQILGRTLAIEALAICITKLKCGLICTPFTCVLYLQCEENMREYKILQIYPAGRISIEWPHRCHGHVCNLRRDVSESTTQLVRKTAGSGVFLSLYNSIGSKLNLCSQVQKLHFINSFK